LADEVDSGYRLSDALSKRPTIFSHFYVSVVKSGETSGKLEEVLEYLANEMEKDYDMNNKIKGAMIYPAFVFGGLLIVGLLMMAFVVPKLTDVLKESGGQLPMATKLLIGVSGFLSQYWWLVFIGLGGLVAGFTFFIRQRQGREIIDRLILHLPVFGRLFQRIYLVRFTRTMNTLIVGGVTIVDSLKVAAEVTGNSVYKKLIEDTVIAVEEGSTISGIFINHPQVPKMVSQMIGVGEKTGKLDIVLDRITHFYTREIDNIVANLMTLLEPIIMVFMGVAVGLMVAAIILPMYNLASQI
jgi:type IV pilus assembly protein PilC